jgi:hypothetical protein
MILFLKFMIAELGPVQGQLPQSFVSAQSSYGDIKYANALVLIFIKEAPVKLSIGIISASN